MLHSRRLLGLPVIDIDTGRALGRVQRLVLDPRARRIMALVVGSGGWAREEQVLLWEQARGVGPAAVTVAGAQALQRAASLPEVQALLRRPVRSYGVRVVTEDGTYLGTVEELMVDPASGQVVELILAASGLRDRLRPRRALSASSVVVMGEDAVVARAGARPYPLRPSRAAGDGQPGPQATHPPAPSPASSRPGTDAAAFEPHSLPQGVAARAVLQRLVLPVQQLARKSLARMRGQPPSV